MCVLRITIEDSSLEAYSECLDFIAEYKNPIYVLCVIPTNRDDISTLIKRKLYVEQGGKTFKTETQTRSRFVPVDHNHDR